MSTKKNSPEPEPVQANTAGTGTARRVVLTILIIGGALVFMVLPWAFLFHSPEQFAGWAASGVVLAVALHLFLATRRRRRDLQWLLEQEEGKDDDEPADCP
jgi:membrane protein implicated in regulation of membrane protease activity